MLGIVGTLAGLSIEAPYKISWLRSGSSSQAVRSTKTAFPFPLSNEETSLGVGKGDDFDTFTAGSLIRIPPVLPLLSLGVKMDLPLFFGATRIHFFLCSRGSLEDASLIGLQLGRQSASP